MESEPSQTVQLRRSTKFNAIEKAPFESFDATKEEFEIEKMSTLSKGGCG